ncbi:MAG: ATP-binding cassette domain-containing protein [Methylobacterium sp.]|nr:ATP-binding cassette domain-containing protein [Methylobacterium sp.]
MTGVGLLNLAVPVSVQALINTVTMGGLIKPLLVISIMLFTFMFLSGVFYVLEMYVVELIQRRIFLKTALDASRKAQSVDRIAHDQLNMSELMNRFFEITAVQKATAMLLTTGMASVLQGVIGCLILLTYSIYFGVVIVLVLLFISVIIFVIGRKAEATAIDESNAKYQVAAWLETIAHNLNTFKFSAGLDLVMKRADDLSANYLSKRKKHFRILATQYIGGALLYSLAGTLMLALGGALVIRGQINLGQFVAAELIIFAVLASFLRLIGQLEYFYDLLAAVDKLGYLENLAIEKQGVHLLKGQDPLALSVSNVSYEYLPRAPVLQGVSFTLAAGESLAIVGPSGSGKSTLAEILTGLRTPTTGHLEYNSIELCLLNLHQVRKHIGFVSKVEIIEDSILENVRIGRSDISVENVTALLEDLGLMQTVNNLEKGLETRLTPSGAPFSTTEARLLMLARAIAAFPALLVIDSLFDALGEDDLDLAYRAITHRSACTCIVLTRFDHIAARFGRSIRLEDTH